MRKMSYEDFLLHMEGNIKLFKYFPIEKADIFEIKKGLVIYRGDNPIYKKQDFEDPWNGEYKAVFKIDKAFYPVSDSALNNLYKIFNVKSKKVIDLSTRAKKATGSESLYNAILYKNDKGFYEIADYARKGKIINYHVKNNNSFIGFKYRKGIFTEFFKNETYSFGLSDFAKKVVRNKKEKELCQ